MNANEHPQIATPPIAISVKSWWQDRVEALEAAIRKHMNQRGDDRCHLDDGELYSVLPEGDTRPLMDTAVLLVNCERFIQCRQQGREYVSPQRMIEELEAEVARLKQTRQQEICGL